MLAGTQIHLDSFSDAVELLQGALDEPRSNRRRVRTMLVLSFALVNLGEFVHAMRTPSVP